LFGLQCRIVILLDEIECDGISARLCLGSAQSADPTNILCFESDKGFQQKTDGVCPTEASTVFPALSKTKLAESSLRPY
jgi:hypothetical protein